MHIRTLWNRGVAGVISLLVLLPSMLTPMAGTMVLAAEEVKPQIATPSAGMRSMDKIVYSANALDFGADNTGVNDATEAIQNAINAVNDMQGGVVFLPAGRYKLEGVLKIPGAVTLRGEWVNPDEGGLGKGTILMAYSGRGIDPAQTPVESPLISLDSGSCLRDISIWYPEQDPVNPVPYATTIYGYDHTNVLNVTLYNAYYGFYNNHCPSMLIRRMYGTVLYRGIHGAYAFDVPRIENVYFDTKYWAESGLEGAPSGETLDALNTYVENNLVALQAGEQDWGYWYDINVNHAKYGILMTAVPEGPKDEPKTLTPANIAVGKVTMRNVEIGVNMAHIGWPGFELTYADIEATKYGMYYSARPDYSEYEGLKVQYEDDATVVVSASSFKGGKAGFWSDKIGPYGVNLNDCRFEDWSDTAIYLRDGNLVCSNGQFNTDRTPITLHPDVAQAVLVGNRFASSEVVTGEGWSDTDDRIERDDDTSIPHTPDYDYTYVSDVQPTGDALFNVRDYGAVAGDLNRFVKDELNDDKFGDIPAQDSTAAFQQALDEAGEAGGGTVYVPAGLYRLEGALTVPTGVELRGTFDSAHYANGTHLGSHLFIYGGKDEKDGAPLITLAEGAGVKGLTIAYPEQGYTDLAEEESLRVHAYPPTIRAAKDTWIQNMAMIGTYTAIDAMTNRCDNIVITDVSGAALYATLIMGHGIDGGHVQNLHFNYSGWTGQWRYPNRPNGDDTDMATHNGMLADYTTRVTKGIVLGDVQNVNFFSCFNIIVAEQIVLEKDPYTGGDYEGVMWGVAFDAATHGVVGRAGSKANLSIVSSMGVFNRQTGGYNVKTEPGFTGYIGLFNADAWDARSNLAYVEGGTVDLVQYFSWCAYNGICRAGSQLNLYGSTIISHNNDDNGTVPDITYGEGAVGRVIGNLDCREKLNIITHENSYVEKKLNGLGATVAEVEPVDRSELAQWLDTQKQSDDVYGYNEDSVAIYKHVFETAQQVCDRPDATSFEIKTQIEALKAADNLLKRAQREGEVSLMQSEVTSPVGHYLSVKHNMAASPVDLTRYYETGMTITLKLRINKIESSFPEMFKDLPEEEWIPYIKSGSIYLWGADSSDSGRIKLGYALDGGAGQLEYVKVGEYIDLTFQVPASIIQTGKISRFEIFMYNDLHRLAQKLDPDNADRYTDGDTSNGKIAVGNVGVTLSVQHALLHYNTEVEADKGMLTQTVQAMERVVTAPYTPQSVQAFTQALKQAQALLADTNARQAEVNEARRVLLGAQKDLLLRADKEALNTVLEEVKALDPETYTPNSYQSLSQALTNAEAVAANDDATQAQVDEAIQQVQNRLIDLVLRADTAALKAAVETAQARLTDGMTYSTETTDAVTAQIVAAQALLDDGNAAQTEVDAVVQGLTEAVAGLQYKRGDVNGAGAVNAEDALMVLQMATNKIHPTAIQATAADVDGTPGVTPNDALLILQYATKKITSLTLKG